MAEPLVVRLANEYRQQLAEREAGAVREMVEGWLKVEQALEANIADLVEKLAEKQAAGQAISEAELFRLDRYRALLAQTLEQVSRFNGQAASRIDELQQQAAGQGLENATDLIEATARTVSLTFDRLGVEATENLVAVARAGQPLNRLLAAAYPQGVTGMTDQMIRGVALGINPREVTRRILREGLAQSLNHVLLVTRDQHLRAYREATRQQYRHSRVVYGYRRLAAKQPGRTCLSCLALDGQEQKLNELIPVHPQDRCSIIPVLKGFEPVQIVSGENYFKSLTEENQREWMGIDRYNAWKEGRFRFEDMAKVIDNTSVWGPSLQVRSLKELLGEA